MVPDTALTKNSYIVLLKTFSNILNHLKVTSMEKQQSILDQDWDKLADIVHKQEQLKKYIDENEKSLEELSSRNSSVVKMLNSEPESRSLTKLLKNTITDYKEIEQTNVKLLNDALYCAKQKVGKLFKLKPKRTYTKTPGQEVQLWSENPVLLDKRI